MAGSEPGVMVTRVVYHKAKPGREARFLQMMIEVADAWNNQNLGITVTRYRSATSERGVYVVLVKSPRRAPPPLLRLDRRGARARVGGGGDRGVPGRVLRLPGGLQADRGGHRGQLMRGAGAAPVRHVTEEGRP